MDKVNKCIRPAHNMYNCFIHGLIRVYKLYMNNEGHLSSQAVDVAFVELPQYAPEDLTGPREHGRIVTLHDNYGFLSCIERKQTLFFHFNEVRTMQRSPHLV